MKSHVRWIFLVPRHQGDEPKLAYRVMRWPYPVRLTNRENWSKKWIGLTASRLNFDLRVLYNIVIADSFNVYILG